MVSTMRFRSVKAIEMGWRRSYLAIFLAAVVFSLIAIYPRVALVVMAYSYVLFGLVLWGIGRIHKRHHDTEPARPSSL